MGKYIHIYFFFLLIKIFLTTPDFWIFEAGIILKDTNIEGYYLGDKSEEKICVNWIPSLFLPLLYAPKTVRLEDETLINDYSPRELFFPVFYNNTTISVNTYQDVNFLNENFQSKIMKERKREISKCYFGLSRGVNNFESLKEEDITLNYLKKKNLINKKIFSFGIWNLTNNRTTFYLGDSHENFNSSTGIIGTCESYSKDSPWGCSFKKMLFNNKSIPLEDNGSLYKIYFSSETHDLIFPNSFKEIFKNYTNKLCNCTSDNYLSCPDYFKVSKYVPIQLTEENDNFVITGQVDSFSRYNTEEENKKDYARIQFNDINCIILPLIVFKEFHVQFDAESNLIKFYTKDSNILKVKEIKKEEKEEKEESSALTTFLVILIILILLGLCLVAIWFIKYKRKNESDIKEFNKFEDEEGFKNLTEKTVF
mgnify:CR=1 FL=1